MSFCTIFLLVTSGLFQIDPVWGSVRVDPLVNSPVGLIRGLQATDGDYSMFMGIPYGKVNESNPFGPPLPYPIFETEFEAFDDTSKCPQMSNGVPIGTLHCLHLHIYVPNSASSSNRLPVLVWIYGGSFSTGYAGREPYGPKFLMKHEIILVSVNYRIGPFGFMCLDTPEVPGNQGLRDQRLALKWIKSNIDSFGGDSNKITLYGQSAGGISVDYHLTFTLENLFDRVIISSGTSYMPQLIVRPDPLSPVRIANQLGFATDDAAEALSYLFVTDPLLVVEASTHFDRALPCVEKDNDDKFINDYPVNVDVIKAKTMPILIGFNSHELNFNYTRSDSEYYEKDNEFHDRLKAYFDFEDNYLIEMEEVAQNFYIGDEKIGNGTKFQVADFASDFKYNHPTKRSVDKYLENGAENVFFYVFSYDGERNYNKYVNNITVGGATHSDDLGYIFDIPSLPAEPSSSDQLMIDQMTLFWTNFVKYGDPTPEISEVIPVKWQPMTRNIWHYMSIDKQLALKKRPFHDRMSFWDLFFEMNGHLQEGYNNQKSQNVQ